MPAERRWLFSQDQGSTYLLCRLTMYESSSLCYVTKHEVFVLFFFFLLFSFSFLSSWSTKISSKATGDVTSRLWRLKGFIFFRNICVIIVNTNTLKMHSYRRQRGCSFLFWGKWLSNNLPLCSCMTIFCLCLQKAGRREQKSVWTNSLYCNLFYSTFPWRK